MRKIEKVVEFLLIALAVAVTWAAVEKMARAGPLERDQSIALYAVAYGQAGIGVPEHSPRILLKDQAELAAKYCGHPCAVKAALIDGEIWLDRALDMQDPMNASILLHEMVHYVQFSRYGPAKSCDEHRERELQAYRIQAFALDRIGIGMAVPDLPACT